MHLPLERPQTCFNGRQNHVFTDIYLRCQNSSRVLGIVRSCVLGEMTTSQDFFFSAVVLNLHLTVSHSQYKSDKSVPEVFIQRSKVITKLIVTNSLRQIPANFK